MGTRSLTCIMDGNQEILTMYQQWNGYPNGVGNNLKEAFGGTEIVNGLGANQSNIANGMGCLAAQLVAKFKTEPGSVYIEPAGTRDCGEEYVYTLSEKDSRVYLEMYGGPVTFFGGSSKKGATEPIWHGFLADFDAEAAKEAYNRAYEEWSDEEKGPKT